MKPTDDQLLILKNMFEDARNGYFDEDYEEIFIEVDNSDEEQDN